MKTDTVDLWEEDFLPAPARTRLFGLEMMGVGTINQESLSSYLVRLANCHSVNPNRLVAKVLFPQTAIAASYTAGNFASGYAKTLNGLGKYATEFSRVLSEMTGRGELFLGTCLPWREILDRKAIGLLHPHPRWCPLCFREWRADNQEVYWPLSWFLAPIAHCTQHRKRLEDRCPTCNRHQPFIPKHYHADHCSHCGCSLALNTKEHDPRAEMPPKSMSRYFSSVLCELIADAPNSKEYATQRRLVSQLKRLSWVLGEGNSAEMHRRLGLREKTVVGWERDNSLPTVASLLTLCHRIGIKPVSFLRDEIPDKLDLGQQRYAAPTLRIRYELSKNEKARVETYLIETLNDVTRAPSLLEVAITLGYPRTFLRYWWRDTVLAITRKHKEAVRRRSEQRVEVMSRKIEEIAVAMFEAQPSIPINRILERARAEGITLPWPIARRVIKATQARYLA